VIVTQVVPHYEADLPIVHEYRRALGRLPDSPTPDFVSLEGYVAARMLFRALERTSEPVTSHGIVAALEGLGDFDLGLGTILHLSGTEHQACHCVWPTMLSGGKVVSIDWSAIAPSNK
jgi:hypothetical protein